MADTRDPASMVFNTVELLENILRLVDMRTLLFSQRVNKAFEATIRGSSKLQQKLFFQATPAGSQYECTESDCVCEPFPIHYNLLLAHRFLPGATSTYARAFFICTEGCVSLNVPLKGRPAGPLLASGSWRRMLISQPPSSRSFAIECEDDTLVWRHEGEAHTMEEVVEHFWPRA